MESINKVLHRLQIDNHITSTKSLKVHVLFYAFVIMLSFSFLFLPYRLYHYQQAFGLSSIGSMIIGALGLVLLSRGKTKYALILHSLYAYIFFGILTYLEIFTLTQVTLVLGGYLFMIMFIAEKNAHVLLHFIAVSALLIMVHHHKSANWPENMVILSSLFAFFFIIMNLVHRLQDQLRTEVEKVNQLNNILVKKNEEIQMFTNIMAHDLKAPLRSIKGFNFLISKKIATLENTAQSEEFVGYQEIINESISGLESLIEDLLLKSKISFQHLQVERCDLEEIVNEIIQKFSYDIRSQNITVELINLREISADRTQLSVLLTNLISNAIKYQPLDARATHSPCIKISQVTEAQHAIITITDNGIGISEEFLGSIFEPFKRLHGPSKYKGTGLGLSICKSIIEKHQGSITVNSAVGVGTTFTMRLPQQRGDF